MTKSTSGAEHKKHKHSLILSIRNSFFTGVIVALPIAVTFWVIFKLVNFADTAVKPLIPEGLLPFPIPGIGIIIAVVGLWMLGVLAANFFGSRLLRLGENILSRIPFVRTIYGTLKQIVSTMAQQKDKAFKDVCMLEYPRKGLYAIGFVTADLKGAPAEHLTDDFVCVFVPTTPNPTSGFLLFVKREELTILDMTPEEGAKMIISGGMVTSNEDLVDDAPKALPSPTSSK